PPGPTGSGRRSCRPLASRPKPQELAVRSDITLTSAFLTVCCSLSVTAGLNDSNRGREPGGQEDHGGELGDHGEDDRRAEAPLTPAEQPGPPPVAHDEAGGCEP